MCMDAREKRTRETNAKKDVRKRNASFEGLEEKKMRAAKYEQRHDTPLINSVC